MPEITEKPWPELITIECKACGRCITACPKKVLKMGDKLNERGYNYVEYEGVGCTGCANCYYTCPEPNAIIVHIPLKAKGE